MNKWSDFNKKNYKNKGDKRKIVIINKLRRKKHSKIIYLINFKYLKINIK